jgi:hypothetical protein
VPLRPQELWRPTLSGMRVKIRDDLASDKVCRVPMVSGQIATSGHPEIRGFPYALVDAFCHPTSDKRPSDGLLIKGLASMYRAAIGSACVQRLKPSGLLQVWVGR